MQGTDALPPLSKRRKVCGEAVPEEQKALSEVPETPVREEDKAVDVKPSLSEREAAVPHREPAHSSSPIQVSRSAFSAFTLAFHLSSLPLSYGCTRLSKQRQCWQWSIVHHGNAIPNGL